MTSLVGAVGAMGASVRRRLDWRATARSARSAAYTTAGLAALSYAGYQLAHPIGWALAGVSLLVLDWLTSRPPPGGHR